MGKKGEVRMFLLLASLDVITNILAYSSVHENVFGTSNMGHENIGLSQIVHEVNKFSKFQQ